MSVQSQHSHNPTPCKEKTSKALASRSCMHRLAKNNTSINNVPAVKRQRAGLSVLAGHASHCTAQSSLALHCTNQHRHCITCRFGQTSNNKHQKHNNGRATDRGIVIRLRGWPGDTRHSRPPPGVNLHNTSQEKLVS